MTKGDAMSTETKSTHIKVRPKGKKRFQFLTSGGGLNSLRIHAAVFTPERAAQVAAEIRAEHGDLYELQVNDEF